MKITGGSAVAVLVGAIVAAGAGFGFNWVTARALGPSGTGVVLSFATWFTILLTLEKVGLDTAVMREAARAMAGVCEVPLKFVLRWAALLAAPISIVASGCLWTWAQPLGRLLADDPGVDRVAIIRVGALVLPFAVIGLILLSAVRGTGDVVAFVAIEQVGKPVLRMAGAVVLIAFGVASAFTFSLAWAVPTLIGFAATATWLHRVSRRWPRFVPSGPDAIKGSRRGLWRFAGPRAVNQGVDIVSSSVGVVLLAAFSTATETGLFGTAMRISLAGLLVYHAVRLLVSPAIAHAIAANDRERMRRIYESSNVLLIAMSWPVYLFVLGGTGLVLGLFGGGFGSAVGMLQILVLAGMGMTFLGNMQTVVLMAGSSSAALGATCVGFVANLAITVLLLGSLGGVGAAVGWAAGAVAEAAVLLRVVRGMGLDPAGGATIRIAAKTAMVFGPVAVLLAIGPLWWVGVAAYVVAGAVWFGWSRSALAASWRRLTEQPDRLVGGAGA